MVVPGVVWLVLLVVELKGNFTPLLESAGTAIWIVFV